MQKTADIFLLIILLPLGSVKGDFPQYGANPFSFKVAESVYGYGSSLFAADLNGDTLLDFAFRSTTFLYAYDHGGALLWKTPISYPGPTINLHGSKQGAADADNDGQIEIIALNDSNQVKIYNGTDGHLETIYSVSVSGYQKLGVMAVADLRGQGDRDLVIQTMDVTEENFGKEYYINRSLIALRLDTGQELWRVAQDRDTGNGIYEGYWGPAHGNFRVADVDGDGKDEIVGGNMVDHDGTVIDLGYPRGWVGWNPDDGFVDHLDMVTVGDYRPDLPGLEWVVCEEDWVDGPTEYYAWNTTLMSKNGVIWRKNVPDLPVPVGEPQEAVAGNFSLVDPFAEVWLSSRLPRLDRGYDSQRPWVYDRSGNMIAAYLSKDALPANFNHHENGNGEGIEPACTIDWEGGKKETIAAKARHDVGNIGVFDAMTGSAVWSTVNSVPALKANSFYVADVSGDGREEIVVYDYADSTVKVFWNGNANTNQPKPDKWSDALYRRIKQNYNLYSTGGYTYGDYPLISGVTVDSITTHGVKLSWTTDQAGDSRVHYGVSGVYDHEAVKDTAALTQNHAVRIDSLLPNRMYIFQIESRNQYDKAGLSQDSSFHTLPVTIGIKVFLEGPYHASGDTMGLSLNAAGQIPKTSPYSADPRSVTALPPGVVDWILVQLRNKADTSETASRSVFLKKDGVVVADDGIETKIDLNAVEGAYFIVIRHRNHLAVMSADTVGLSTNPSIVYDFTDAGSKAFGTGGMKEIEAGVWGMWAGDTDFSGSIGASDRNNCWNDKTKIGYRLTDCDLSGTVGAADRNLVWNNRTKLSKVP
jgi:hypothetical protein